MENKQLLDWLDRYIPKPTNRDKKLEHAKGILHCYKCNQVVGTLRKHEKGYICLKCYNKEKRK